LSAAGTLPVSLGFRAQRGGAVVVVAGLAAGSPQLVLSTFLATAAAGDRLALEPYHVAFEMPRGPAGEVSPEVVAAVAEGRRRQGEMARTGLDALLRGVRELGGEPVVAALLVNRVGWLTDLLEHSLSAPEHPPVHEGLAVREALRSAFGRSGLPTTEMDEKLLPETAQVTLGLSPAELDARLKLLGAAAGKPWRKEQKAACLAAWVALAAR
jgi:hypothetical protein